MSVILLLSWWYGRGWFWVAGSFARRLKNINEIFSVSILLKTIFSPWKQIQSPKTFQNFIQSSVDNLISRFIGAVVRLGMLFAAFVLSFVILLAGLISLVIWPLLPLSVVLVPIISLMVVGS